MSSSFHIGGRWGEECGGHSPITMETKAEGGLGDASWTMTRSADQLPAFIRKRALVEVVSNGVPTYVGRILEVTREGGIRLRSLFDDCNTIPALDGTGAATRDVATAIAQARANGWEVANSTLTGTVVGDNTEPISAGDLLRLYAQQENKLVGVDAQRNVTVASMPTKPLWVVTHHDAELSSIDFDEPNAVAGRYRTSGGAVGIVYRFKAGAPKPIVMKTVDLTVRGVLTSAQAGAILDKVLERLDGRVRWSNDLELRLSQIQNTTGASPTSPTAVRGGHMARLLVVSAAQQREVRDLHLDVVLGSVVHTDGEDVVTVTPLDAIPTTFEEAMEAVA